MGTNLLNIPGIGKTIKKDLNDMGYNNVESLKDKHPDELYEELCNYKGYKVDRCMLYVFRCAVYYASNNIKNEDLLRWYKWKD